MAPNVSQKSSLKRGRVCYPAYNHQSRIYTHRWLLQSSPQVTSRMGRNLDDLNVYCLRRRPHRSRTRTMPTCLPRLHIWSRLPLKTVRSPQYHRQRVGQVKFDIEPQSPPPPTIPRDNCLRPRQTLKSSRNSFSPQMHFRMKSRMKKPRASGAI